MEDGFVDGGEAVWGGGAIPEADDLVEVALGFAFAVFSADEGAAGAGPADAHAGEGPFGHVGGVGGERLGAAFVLFQDFGEPGFVPAVDGGFFAELLGGEPLDAGDPAGAVEAVFHDGFGGIEDIDKGHQCFPVGAGGADVAGDVFGAFGGAGAELFDGAAGFFEAGGATGGEAGVEEENQIGEFVGAGVIHEHGFEDDGDVFGDHGHVGLGGHGVGGVCLGGELLGEGGFEHFTGDDAAFGAALFLPVDVDEAVAGAVCPVAGTEAHGGEVAAHGGGEVVAQDLLHALAARCVIGILRHDGEGAFGEGGEEHGLAIAEDFLGEVDLVVGGVVPGHGWLAGFVCFAAGAVLACPPALPGAFVALHEGGEPGGVSDGGLQFAQGVVNAPAVEGLGGVDHVWQGAGVGCGCHERGVVTPAGLLSSPGTTWADCGA